MRAQVSRPVSVSGNVVSHEPGTYKLGQRVRHEKFGEGVVLQREGSGAQERIQINFQQVGIKWLMLSYAKLEGVGA